MSRFDFKWLDFYDPLRRSDVFYCMGNHHNPVLEISFDDRRVMIACDGEMNFWYNDVKVRSDKDLPDAGIRTDTDWHNAMETGIHDGLFPWFDAYEYLEDNHEWFHLDMVYGDLNEIILAVQRLLLFPETLPRQLVWEGLR